MGDGLVRALVEAQYLGGTCLNVGCIPSKALLESARHFASLKTMGAWGIELAGDGRLNMTAVMGRVRGISVELAEGVARLLKGNGVTVCRGHATIATPGRVTATGSDGQEPAVQAHRILLARRRECPM